MNDKVKFPTEENIPTELLGLRRWIGWRKLWDDGKKKWKKPPASPLTGEGIGAVAKYAEHWLTAAEAIAGAVKFKLDGIGFVFARGDGYAGIDFDDCVVDGVIDPTINSRLNLWFQGAWIEYSISGTGVHAICRGTIPAALTATPIGDRGATIEMYGRDRFFAVSGKTITLAGGAR